MIYRAGVIGLGQIGNTFDQDPKRKLIWTHAGAYQSVEGVDLVTGADPELEKRNDFSFMRNISATNIYADYREMLAQENLQIVSICVPTLLHEEVTLAVLSTPGIKAIVLEKPIAYQLDEAHRIIDIAQSKNIILAVNHARRWDNHYQKIREIVQSNYIGKVRTVSNIYPGKIYNVGTHLFDILYFIFGDVNWVIGQHIDGDSEGIDASYGGYCQFTSGAMGSIGVLGKKENLVFEIDIIGEKGRIQSLNNGKLLKIYQFETSSNYSSYQELVLKEQIEAIESLAESFMVKMIADVVKCIGKPDHKPLCTGKDAFNALNMAKSIIESANNGNKKIILV